MNGGADFHNHVMPGVDDGAQDADDCAQALAAFRADGVTTVVATPHFDASLTQRPDAAALRLAELDGGWDRLTEVATRFADMTILRGAEVMLDTPQPDLSDLRLHLAGGRFVLVEFPFMTIPPESARALTHIRNSGIIPVLAHPERYSGMVPGSLQPLEWKAAGALLQVNGPSLLGRYGKQPRANALDLLERGLIDFVCSDYHARGVPQLTECTAWFARHDAEEQGHLLMKSNTARLLRDELPLPVMPLKKPARGLSRLLPWKR